MKPTFQDRQDAIEQICVQTDHPLLLNIYGEAGIGKSRLLAEASQEIRKRDSPSLVLQVDLELLTRASPADRPKQLLQYIIDQAQEWLSGVWQDTEQVAGQIVAQLSQLAKKMPVYLMFDTTEVFQEKMEFWRWLEEYLVSPLAAEGQIQQVFAGRVPVPWRRVEVRRILKLYPLDPLPPEDEARNLVREVLLEINHNLKVKKKEDKTLEEAVDLVMEFSFGHPLLSEHLAAKVGPRWPTPDPKEFKRELCSEVIKPFIDEYFFKEIIYPWNEILWWASVLDWFDVTVLQRYLKLIDPQLTDNQTDYFFIQGISRLRLHYTIIWREERGDRLHGIVGKIVRHCLEVSEPERYRQACLAAAETMEALAAEFPEEYPEFEQYRTEAEAYRRRAQQEG